ncbi:MAG: ABC transporter ATP-binding protein [Verrucomicrobia bacterium]|nr:ABC transporter ATP-binding protein [Verrucomicrobiota bacterium]
MNEDVPTPEAAVVAERLTKKYGSLTAIEDLSFTVAPGEIVGFLGPNGAGKSTTMRILSGTMSGTSGRAAIWGASVALDPVGAKRHMAYMPENNPLPEDLRVEEYLTLRARLKDVRAAGRLIGQLSKGFRQRVGIADALLAEPKVVILDEPTIGLDPHQILGIRDLIRSLRGKMAVLISSHILHEVEQVCDKVVIINRGRLVAQGRTDDLRRELLPESSFSIVTRASISELTLACQRLEPAAGVEMVSQNDGAIRYRVILPATSPIRETLASGLIAGGLNLREISEEKFGLEDIFLAATRRSPAENRRP